MHNELDEWDDPSEAEDAALADFDIGFQSRLENKPLEPGATRSWIRGWRVAAGEGGHD
jgi:hypothetical protein